MMRDEMGWDGMGAMRKNVQFRTIALARHER